MVSGPSQINIYKQNMEFNEYHASGSIPQPNFEGWVQSIQNTPHETETPAHMNRVEQPGTKLDFHFDDPAYMQHSAPQHLGEISAVSALGRVPVEGHISHESTFLEVITKLRLLPIIVRMLCFDGLPSLEDAQRQAIRVLEDVRSEKPEDTVLHARCCYYVGIADYLLYLHSLQSQAPSKRRQSIMRFKHALEAEKRYPEGKWAAEWIDFCDQEELSARDANAEASSTAAESLRGGFQRLRAWLMGLGTKPPRSTQDAERDASKSGPERVPTFSTWSSARQSSAHESGSAPSVSRSGTLESTQKSNVTGKSSETSRTEASISPNKDNNGRAGKAFFESLLPTGKIPALVSPFFSPSWKPAEPDPIYHYGDVTSSPEDEFRELDAPRGLSPSIERQLYSPTTQTSSESHAKGIMGRTTYPPGSKPTPMVYKRRATFASPLTSNKVEDGEKKSHKTMSDRPRRKSSWGHVLGLTKQNSDDDLALAEAGESPKFVEFMDHQTLSSLDGHRKAIPACSSISPEEVRE